ncbi:histidine kinase dimerization/phospho-acceptor domain-containing protein [Altererythrobacter sp. MF3-039]|uniref:histidine kinase dimerization/phospho-acceptor domain-containing protein n=1 Tax=Altererythrobacter sp. MF3-039 TaxID=3252901 RepID=UPI00390C4608
MHFDDRLATVLRHRAAGEAAARTQFRQLLDLLGARREGKDESLRAAAWLRLGALGELIPAKERASMIAERGWRFENPDMAMHLAEDEPEVAAAALARAHLTSEEWVALIPTLPIRARGFLRLRDGLPPDALRVLEQLGVQDRGLPMPRIDDPQTDEDHSPDTVEEPFELTAENEIEDETSETSVPRGGEISALVKRIEAFQRARSETPTVSAPRLPLGEIASEPARAPLLGFTFSTDASGKIDWAEPRVAPMVIGMDVTQFAVPDSATAKAGFAGAFQSRQPLRNAKITLEGADAITGEWVLDAVPRFTRPPGRFYGYAGKLRRFSKAEQPSPTSRQQRDADRIRQLLHELRTPVNAIQGFAEVIQQQLFGATPHEYRALAASIAGDSARMLAGFDELDRLAKLEAGIIALEDGETDFGDLVRRQVNQLQAVLKPRVAGFEARLSDVPCEVSIAESDSEQLSWRILASIAGLVRGGERLGLELSCDREEVVLACELPAALVPKDDLFATDLRAGSDSVSSGIFGAGFSLRLARAEAKAAGGNLVRIKDHLVLTLPLKGRDRTQVDTETPRNRATSR